VDFFLLILTPTKNLYAFPFNFMHTTRPAYIILFINIKWNKSLNCSCSRHENMWMKGALAPLILNIETSWRCLVNYKFLSLNSKRRSDLIHWISGQAGLRTGINTVKQKVNFLPWLGVKTEFLNCTTASTVTVLTELPWFQCLVKDTKNAAPYCIICSIQMLNSSA